MKVTCQPCVTAQSSLLESGIVSVPFLERDTSKADFKGDEALSLAWEDLAGGSSREMDIVESHILLCGLCITVSI